MLSVSNTVFMSVVCIICGGGCIYKRGLACRFLDRGKYVFFPGYCVFATIGSNVLFWLLGFFLELHTCPRSHSGQKLFSPAYRSNRTGYYILGIHYAVFF